MPLNNFWGHFDRSKSLFFLLFFFSVRWIINPVKWILIFVVFWKGVHSLKVISQHCVLRYGIWRFSLHNLLKNPPNEYRYYCTVFTVRNRTTAIASNPYHAWTRLHQLRTINDDVTPTPYHECTQFIDSVKSQSFSLTWGFSWPMAFIYGKELVWPRSFMVRYGVDAIW